MPDRAERAGIETCRVHYETVSSTAFVGPRGARRARTTVSALLGSEREGACAHGARCTKNPSNAPRQKFAAAAVTTEGTLTSDVLAPPRRGWQPYLSQVLAGAQPVVSP